VKQELQKKQIENDMLTEEVKQKTEQVKRLTEQ